MAINGTLEDNTYGATFYYAPSGVSGEPSWASTIPFIGQIGTQLFFGSGISAAVSGAVASVEQQVSTLTEQVSSGISAMVTSPNITTLLLAGIGIGLVVTIARRKK